MKRSHVIGIAALALLFIPAPAAAQIDGNPKQPAAPQRACAVSGKTKIVNGKAYVCKAGRWRRA